MFPFHRYTRVVSFSFPPDRREPCVQLEIRSNRRLISTVSTRLFIFLSRSQAWLSHMILRAFCNNGIFPSNSRVQLHRKDDHQSFDAKHWTRKRYLIRIASMWYVFIIRADRVFPRTLRTFARPTLRVVLV